MSNQTEQVSLDVTANFILTKAYRLFAEFCDACRRYRYIGICYGSPGVGKTLSARHYARWDMLEPILLHPATTDARPRELIECRSVLYTPPVVNTPRATEKALGELMRRLHYIVKDVVHVHQIASPSIDSSEAKTDLVIVDEADRLKLIHRLCTQIERILQINDLRMVTKEVVDAARETLVIGQV